MLHLVWIMVALSFLTFLLMYITPGDAASKKLHAQGVAVSEEVLEETRKNMGLDRPFIVQYLNWAGGILRGDLGNSFKDDTAVSAKLAKGLRYTLLLSVSSLLLALIVALPLSILTALKKGGVLDFIVRVLSFIGNSLPNFLISVILMYFLCVRSNILPVIADESAKGLILPCLALSIPMCGRFIRQFRAEILEQLGKSYVGGSLARGVKKRFIIINNVLHNASISILTIVGMSIGTLLGGSVVIETIFRWPGLGKLAMDAITQRDYPVIQGFVLFSAAVYVIINLLTDICYKWIDPRVREQ